MKKKALFLYTEIAPYLLASIKQLVALHGVHVHIVRWPLNKEAPFDFSTVEGITLHERAELDGNALLELARQLEPDVVFASGWVDKAYLRVCRQQRKRGVPTVICSDPAWRGSLRQWGAVIWSRSWIERTFSHAWVPGEEQAEYMRRLGIPAQRIKQGFYSADVERFAPLADRFRPIKEKAFPHRFLCVARYIRIKGHPYMEEAFGELCDEGGAGDWELWCIGTGELYPLAYQHPRIKHLGFVQSDDLWQYMEQTGVYVQPSLYEAWGVAVHEHAAAGFPMILSDAVGARKRFLREGENGTIFKAGDRESLKQAFKRMIARSDEELLAMGRRSDELAQGWGTKEWADVVKALIQEGHG